ncbi:MAG TPA: GntR family transcriptional regulator [Steroidobacteraceae bacterium]|nr:GntR family transcriptional regulator [Steroidobacteraceae bacterium]
MSATFGPLPFEPGYRRIASAIAARILDRTLKDGDALPSELELAAQFAVNRSTVREALRELESADLVARRRGTKRMVVARPATDQVAGRVRHALALNDVTVREVWAMLEVLEPPAAEAAARERTPKTLERIQRAAAVFASRSAATQAAVDGVGEFFRAVAAASANRVLPLMHEPLLLLLEAALRILIDRAPPARARIALAQARVLAAIEAGDADTARIWMGKHVRDFRRGFELCGIDLDTPVPAPPAD